VILTFAGCKSFKEYQIEQAEKEEKRKEREKNPVSNTIIYSDLNEYERKQVDQIYKKYDEDSKASKQKVFSLPK
jgi:hypothetical protein